MESTSNNSPEHRKSADELPTSAPVDSATAPPLPVGRHVLADLYDVSAVALQDETGLMALLTSALRENGFHILDETSFKFPGPGGVTGLVLLSESHASFHTYPENGYIAIDVFSCGMADPAPVVASLIDALQPARVVRQMHRRGRDATES